MRRSVLLLLALACVGAVAAWLISAPKPIYAPGSAELERGGDAERGQEIFYAGGCASCHATPKQDDPTKLGGGLELKSPFGTFIVPNISPDPKDGIGTWKVADLINAMQAGVSPQGEHYYPAFPYSTYTHARLDDIRDLMAFLRTLPPVPGKAPPHRLSFPFNERRLLGFWKLLYLDHSPIDEDKSKSAEWNRGHYLVAALGHCAECHSGRNILGGIEEAYRYAGGPDLEGRGWVPNITPEGLKDYSKIDIAYLLKTGDTPDGDSVGGSMTAVVRNMAKISESDRNAIAEFIKDLPPRASPPKPAKK